jgi:hypothetical protein
VLGFMVLFNFVFFFIRVYGLWVCWGLGCRVCYGLGFRVRV